MNKTYLCVVGTYLQSTMSYIYGTMAYNLWYSNLSLWFRTNLAYSSTCKVGAVLLVQ